MTFPLDLKFYLKKYQNFFDDDFCNNVLRELDNIEWDKHKYYTPEKDYITYDNDLSISYDSIPATEQIETALESLIQHYIHIDMPPEFTWFKAYNGYSNIRFNRYDKNTLMRPHCDHIHDLFDGERKGIPVLSIVGCLNDDYKGGDFVMWGDEKIEIEKGTVIIFPSNFLYPHCVTPVTEGVRYSFVSWVW